VRIGAHVFTPRGYVSGIENALDLGADALQFFASNPRAWAPRTVPEAAAREFRARLAAEGMGPLFIHVTYLVNVASPNPEFLRKSAASAIADLEAAEALGAAGLVVHSGSGGAQTPRGRALERAVDTITQVARRAESAEVLVELTAGTAGSVAATLSEARELFDGLGTGLPIGLTLDTCHLFAAGYALDEPEGVRSCFEELHALGLGDRLRLIHANDAAFPRGSRRDRHTNVGTGGIGERGFEAILAQPAVRDLVVLVETPGSREERRGDVETLRRLAGLGAAA
jgi:deoxyribonuclease-4